MSKIAVAGNASGTGTLTIAAPNTNSDRTLTLPDVTATVITDSAGVLNIGSGQVYKDASGNVGIGTSSPAAKLDVQGDVIFNDPSASLTVKMTSVGGVYNVMDSATGVHSLQFDGGYYSIYDLAASSERVRITSAGNVGIGTSSPAYKLDVLGNVNRFAGAGVDGIFLSTVAATDISYYGANYYNNNGTEGVNASGRASWRIATLTAAGSPTFSIGYRAPSAGAGTFSTPLTINSAGNVGIGTTAPYGTVSVHMGTTAPQDLFWNNPVNMLQLGESGARPLAGLFAVKSTYAGASTYNGDLAFYNLFYAGAADYQWKERMRIQANGNVGIGNSAPATALQLGDGSSGTKKLRIHRGSGTDYTDIWNNTGSTVIDTVGGGSTLFYMSGVEKMQLTPAGNLLVGTTTADAKLHVVGEGTVNTEQKYAFFAGGPSSQPGLYIGGNNTSGSTVAVGNRYSFIRSETPSGGARSLYFQTGSDTRMIVTHDGNLLVGTTSGTSKLNVTTTTASGAAVTFDGSVGNGILLKTTYASATGGTYISFANSAGAATGTINQTGTSTVAYTTSSDYRLKEDVQPMVGALERITALNPVTYKWKADGSDAEGFIAHELQAVIPACVVGEKDAVDASGNPQYQGIDTSFLVATLTAAIQEQQAIIEQLQADVATLKGAA